MSEEKTEQKSKNGKVVPGKPCEPPKEKYLGGVR